MFILSSSDSRQQGFTKYLGSLKKIAAQNSYTSLSARNRQKLCSLHSQLAEAAPQKNFKRTYCSIWKLMAKHVRTKQADR